MLAQRVLSAIVLLPLVLLVVWLGGIWFFSAVTVAALLAAWELYSLLRRAGFSPLWPFGIILVPAFLADRYFAGAQTSEDVLALCLVMSLLYMLVRRNLEGAFLDWALTWVPPLYAGLLLSYVVALRLLPLGEQLVYLALAITWATDTGAYFAGRSFGRHSFFPRISPRKTLEGAIGGIVSGVLAGIALIFVFGLDLIALLPLTLVAALAAELGDLAESFIKRQLGTKDASRLIPGHGGMLDRLDSVVFVAVAVYFWATWVGGAR